MGDQASRRYVYGDDDPHVADDIIDRVCQTLRADNGGAVRLLAAQ